MTKQKQNMKSPKVLPSEFKAAAIAVALAILNAPSGASLITNDPSLPPGPNGGYLSQYHATYTTGGPVFNLHDFIHSGFTNIIRNDVGPNQFESFDSTLTGLADISPGPSNVPISLSGPVQTEVFGKVGNVTGTFNTEMLSMNLSGGGIMVRESPTLAAT